MALIQKGIMHLRHIQCSLLMVATLIMLAASQDPLMNCTKSCGDVKIPYPFGIEPGCYLEVEGRDEQFKVSCDMDTTPPSLVFFNGDGSTVNITNISEGESEVRVNVTTSRNCYINSFSNPSKFRSSVLNLPPSYTISDKNLIFVVGCNRIAIYTGYVSQVPDRTEIKKVGASGVSACRDSMGKQFPLSCSGFGCTRNSIETGLHNISLSPWLIETSGVNEFWSLEYPCSYSFITDESSFTFSGDKSFDELEIIEFLPVVVNWAIGDGNCKAAASNQTSYACKDSNSKCVDRSSGGYFCECLSDYEGNPYLPGGCKAEEFRPSRCSNVRCGNVEVPYPFGLESDCLMQVKGQNKQFKLTCDETTTPPSLYFLDRLDTRRLKITSISEGDSELRLMVETFRNCNSTEISNITTALDLPTSYTVSDKNTVFVLGCNQLATYEGSVRQVSGDPTEVVKLEATPMSSCQGYPGNQIPKSCSGFGCVQSPIISGLHNFSLQMYTVSSGNESTKQWDLSYPCVYGFIVDKGNFTFSGNQSFIELKSTTRQQLPVVVDWAIGDENCELASKNRTTFACKGISTRCVDLSIGYVCRCEPGHRGNPYVPRGCTDVDECNENPLRLCGANEKCTNTIGSYTCTCVDGYTNYDNDDNPDCVKIRENPIQKNLKISLGVCLSFLGVVVVTFWIYCGMKRRNYKQLKAQYFKDNGGIILQKELENFNGPQAAKIFTKEELKTATNNFHDSGKIGEGGYGYVYRGTLSDKKEVAIKVSKSSAPLIQSNQFINEVLVLSQINHRNVVRILGCCLETRTPLLVYEFVSNGTLYEHIHRKNGKGPLPFGLRMKIAAEIAGSLAYLHYSASMKIVHRDVKATNILLDENFTAKVSDFGASKLVPDDQNQLSTLVQGTLGYLDPEYLQSNTLTEKSDVYSFGVVLVELITSQVAISYQKPEAERNLANVFTSSVEENRLDKILDHEIIKEGSYEIAEKVAYLAKKCLSLRGSDRPTMREVTRELDELLATMAKNSGTDHLLASFSNLTRPVEIGSPDEYDQSLLTHAVPLYEDGR